MAGIPAGYPETAREVVAGQTTRSKGEIQTLLEKQTQVISMLNDTVDTLSHKLDPVMSPKPVNPENDSDKLREESDPARYVTTHLRFNSQVIEGILRRVRIINEQVDL
jgi:hypothetical protein